MNQLEDHLNDIHQGDAVETLKQFPENSVHMAMCSPPYFGLRDYGVDGQIGLEDSLDEYIQQLVDVGEALRRVLRADGSWWLNLGDSFGGDSIVRSEGEWTRPGDDGYEEAHTASYGEGRRSMSSLGRKNKMLVPHRVAITLQDAGWVVRSDAVWAKPNPMPHPVKDRFREDKEFIFHLTPEPDYWFDLDAIREPHKDSSFDRGASCFESSGTQMHGSPEEDGARESVVMDAEDALHPNGKNPGDILEVSVKPFPEAHFAVYPPDLCETPIKATCPPEVCGECGTPYERVETETEEIPTPNTDREQGRRALEKYEQSDLSGQHLRALRAVGFTDAGQAQDVYDGHGNNTKAVQRLAAKAKDVLGGYAREFLGERTGETEWQQACDCATDNTESGVVLDPFAGAGTTCMVAKGLGRRFIGIDLNPEYVAMAQKLVGVTVDEPEHLLDEDETTLEAFADGGVPGGDAS